MKGSYRGSRRLARACSPSPAPAVCSQLRSTAGCPLHASRFHLLPCSAALPRLAIQHIQQRQCAPVRASTSPPHSIIVLTVSSSPCGSMRATPHSNQEQVEPPIRSGDDCRLGQVLGMAESMKAGVVHANKKACLGAARTFLTAPHQRCS